MQTQNKMCAVIHSNLFICINLEIDEAV